MSNVVQVRITRQTVTSRYGVLENNDILRTDQEYARHLVEDCKAGDYVNSSNQTEDDQADSKPRKRNKSTGKS